MIKIQIKKYFLKIFQRSTNSFRERLLDLLLEAKRREYLFHKYEQTKKEFPGSDDSQFIDESDEDQYGRTCKNEFL